MTNTIDTPAGYIVHDNEGIINGFGPTADAAWADMKDTMALAGIALLGDDEDSTEQLGNWTRESGLRIRPASAALIQAVKDQGGNVAWGRGGRIGHFAGVACTRDEAEGR